MRESFGVDLSYDREGVKWVDGFVERMRSQLPPEKHTNVSIPLAEFVGECIVQTYGGTWKQRDKIWGVHIKEDVWVCPGAKVAKQFANGHSDSVLSFFECIPILWDQHPGSFRDNNDRR